MYATWNGQSYYAYFDGTDGAGQLLPAGTYTLRFTAVDKAGNRTTAEDAVELARVDPGSLVAPARGRSHRGHRAVPVPAVDRPARHHLPGRVLHRRSLVRDTQRLAGRPVAYDVPRWPAAGGHAHPADLRPLDRRLRARPQLHRRAAPDHGRPDSHPARGDARPQRGNGTRRGRRRHHDVPPDGRRRERVDQLG